MEADDRKFLEYSSSSNEITLNFELEKHIPNAKHFTNINLNAYKNEFSSNVDKNKFFGYITISKNATFGELKQVISKFTGFPVNIMISFGYWGGTETDENLEKWTNIVKNNDINDKTLIMNSRYNDSKIENRYIYIFIDKNNNQIFSTVNDNQIKNDKKLEKLSEEGKEKNEKISHLEEKINRLNTENDENKREIKNLKKENNILTSMKEKEQERKKEKEKRINTVNEEFIKEKNDIKSKKMEEYKKEINKFLIVDIYINDFEKKKEKNKSSKTLIQSFAKFTEEFMKQSDNYNLLFEQNSKKIIEQYDTNNNNISIEHINFILIGPAGVGKSSFINQSLLLENNKKAIEGMGESVTKESHLYTSDKLTSVRMWDTEGIDFKRNPEVILNEIKNLVNNGLNKGPDSYINIILYCTNPNGKRFQEEEGRLIQKIMALYPSDNLPVIIAQLQAYFKEDAKNMETEIRQILHKYLEEHIVDKIEIKSVVARKKESIKAYGIPELFKCSFDKMGKAITSATSKKFSEEIEGMCEKFVNDKLDFINQIFKDEFELIENAKSLVSQDDNEDEEASKKMNKKPRRLFKPPSKYYSPLSNYNFVKNFQLILNEKFKKVYTHLNGIINDEQNKPYIFTYIEGALNKIHESLVKYSLIPFEHLCKTKFQDYFHDLMMKQSQLNNKYDTNNQIRNASEIENEFKQELFKYYNNEFHKVYLCIIIKLFKDNLQKILEDKFKKIIKENEKSINLKAEAALKNVTERLKEKLLKELDFYYSKEKEDNKILPNPSEINSGSFQDDFEFSL